MDTDRVTGTVKEIGGKIQGAVGDATGDLGTQASGAVRELGGKVQDLYGQAKDSLPDMTDYADRATGVARQVAGKAQDLYGQVRDSLPDAADSAADYAGQAYDQGDHYARRGASLARREIEAYPLSAVLLAGAVGFFIATLFQSRR